VHVQGLQLSEHDKHGALTYCSSSSLLGNRGGEFTCKKHAEAQDQMQGMMVVVVSCFTTPGFETTAVHAPDVVVIC
jgi:hypothetical protein